MNETAPSRGVCPPLGQADSSFFGQLYHWPTAPQRPVALWVLKMVWDGGRNCSGPSWSFKITIQWQQQTCGHTFAVTFTLALSLVWIEL